jgi:hypothetical protein
MAKKRDQNSRRSGTAARVLSICAWVVSGFWPSAVPRAISALSKVPSCSTRASSPLIDCACQRWSALSSAGVMFLRIAR